MVAHAEGALFKHDSRSLVAKFKALQKAFDVAKDTCCELGRACMDEEVCREADSCIKQAMATISEAKQLTTATSTSTVASQQKQLRVHLRNMMDVQVPEALIHHAILARTQEILRQT